jgi:RimJ/RimL family protein N-acetyltransferase
MVEQGQIHTITDGTEVLIRPLTEEDFDKSFKFFSDLPEEDRLYLRVDVADPEVVRRRLKCEEYLNVFRIVAEEAGLIVGDGVLEWPKFGWMAHVGELRAIVSKDFRRRGLATLLFRQLFIHGVREGLEKFEARMMVDQDRARRCVEKLGFTEEGILPGCAMDLKGETHDLVIMSSSVEGF